MPRRLGGRPRRHAPGGEPPSIISPTSASSTICPRPRRPAPAAAAPKQRIGEDLSRELEFIPAKLEVNGPRPAQVRLPEVPRRRGQPAGAPQADTGRDRRPRTGRLRAGQQVRRPPPALSTRRYLDATRRASVAEHLVRLGQERRRLARAAGRAAEDAGVAVAGVVDRRHPRDRARGRESRQYQGSVLGLHRRCRAPLQRLRLHHEPGPRRSGGIPRRTTTVSSRPMPTGATTGSSWARTGRSWKWPAGRTRGGSSTTRGRMRRARRTRCWSGSGNCTTWKTGPGTSRPPERQELRQRESVPILDRIEEYLDELSPRVLPKSALGKAITYARNQRAALRQYVSDGRLTIDNNVSERTLRLQAIGRKNWEFLGSEEAGPRAAVLFTILAGAKRHRLEPWAYVRDVLLRLSAGETDLETVAAGPLGSEPSGARAAAPSRRVAAEGRASEGSPPRASRGQAPAELTVSLEESRRKAARQEEARRARRAAKPVSESWAPAIASRPCASAGPRVSATRGPTIVSRSCAERGGGGRRPGLERPGITRCGPSGPGARPWRGGGALVDRGGDGLLDHGVVGDGSGWEVAGPGVDEGAGLGGVFVGQGQGLEVEAQGGPECGPARCRAAAGGACDRRRPWEWSCLGGAHSREGRDGSGRVGSAWRGLAAPLPRRRGRRA